MSLFIPHKLKTIEVDVEKKIFRVNGEDFGKGCTGFTIYCDGPDRSHITMEMDTRIVFVDYLPGEETKAREIHRQRNNPQKESGG